jgi:hypothetical protein
MDAHTFYGGKHLLTIPDVGAESQSRAPGMFNLEIYKVEFGLATRQ